MGARWPMAEVDPAAAAALAAHVAQDASDAELGDEAIARAAADTAEATTRAAAVSAEAAARSAADALLIPLSQKGAASGVASLDSASHVPEAQVPLRHGLTLLEAYGNSYAVNGDQSAYNVIERISLALNARRRNNRGWGGSISCWPTAGASGDGGYAWLLQECWRPGSLANGWRLAHPETAREPYLPRTQVCVLTPPLNDLGELGSTKPRPMMEAHRAMISRIAAAAIWEDTDAKFVYTGTWANTASTTRNSGTQYKRTTTLNDKVVFTVPADMEAGRAVAILLPIDATHDLTVGIKINGGTQSTVRITGTTVCDQEVAAKHNVVALRWRPPGWGASNSTYDFATQLVAGDTVELQLVTQHVASSALNIDCAHVESDPLDGGLVALMRPNRCPAYTLWNSSPHGPVAGTDPLNDAAIATWDAAVQTLAPEFPNRLILVDIDTTLAKSAANFADDDAHPNARGLGLIAEAVRTAILTSGLLTTRVLNRSIPDRAPFFEPVGTAGRTAFFSTWTNFSATAMPFGYHLHPGGVIEFRGQVKSGPAANTVVVQLGQGGRPHADKYMGGAGAAAAGTPAGTAKLAANGDLNYQQGGATVFQSFDGVQCTVER